SKRRGVRVRITGRRPSARRNSLPFQPGMTSSPPDGRSSRTLAAGWSITRPSSFGPATVTRTSRGVTGVTRSTVTGRKAGGSRRRRTAGFDVIAPASHPAPGEESRDGRPGRFGTVATTARSANIGSSRGRLPASGRLPRRAPPERTADPMPDRGPSPLPAEPTPLQRHHRHDAWSPNLSIARLNGIREETPFLVCDLDTVGRRYEELTG